MNEQDVEHENVSNGASNSPWPPQVAVSQTAAPRKYGIKEKHNIQNGNRPLASSSLQLVKYMWTLAEFDERFSPPASITSFPAAEPRRSADPAPTSASSLATAVPSAATSLRRAPPKLPASFTLARTSSPATTSEGKFKSREQLEEEKQLLQEAKATGSQAKAPADQVQAQAEMYSDGERPVTNMTAGAPADFENYEEQTFSSSESRHVCLLASRSRAQADALPAIFLPVTNANGTQSRNLMNKAKGFRDGMHAKILGQHKDKARERVDCGKDTIDDYFPQERRDRYIYRMKKVIVECRSHNDYQESIPWLLDAISSYFQHSKEIGKQHAKHTAKASKNDGSLNEAWGQLRLLLERFANGVSMDMIFDAANALADDARNDPALKQCLKNANAYIHRVNPLRWGHVAPPARPRAQGRVQRAGQVFFEDKYKGHFDNVFQSIATFRRVMGENTLNVRFGQDLARLTKDLLFDSEGRLAFKSELWANIRHAILPNVVMIGYVPIPRIVYTDDAFDIVIENLVFSGRNLFPNIIKVRANDHFKYSPYVSIRDEGKHEFTLGFSQVQAYLHDVAFYSSKKSGFPTISDSGFADIVLGGENLKATDKSSVLKVKSVKVKVDSLKFGIRDSKHDLLYKTLKPLVMELVRKQNQKAVADVTQTGMECIDGQLVSASENEMRMDALKETKKQEADASSTATNQRYQDTIGGSLVHVACKAPPLHYAIANRSVFSYELVGLNVLSRASAGKK
ncbi:uncharacterized protein SCHCODRAFT_0234537 [Schizophyllum commune H4-8]|uniref:Uncharacterized protein n=1 Tax=Schizophyllum commune (strain H4-8 / FGSC 9210) TaxID=578458 RepID=D8Q2D6_SCHCM|nr:uncharacterized protein SCHCODRAFT_0234537 [Schizophyllum commune H4-8]KAI5895822.1 hypothetical protein SCHCODRAFT_0234537 [Schizophyllum commune H4-8]